MKVSKDRCHVLLSTNENVFVSIGTAQMQNSTSEKLLGVKIHCELNLKEHI